MTFSSQHLPAYIAGNPVFTNHTVKVKYPYDDSLTGTACLIDVAPLHQAIAAALDCTNVTPSRYHRSQILRKTASQKTLLGP